MLTHPTLSLAHQCQLLGMSRSSFYYQSQVDSDEELRMHPSAGRAVSQNTLLRQPQDVAVFEGARLPGQPQASAALDAETGD
jgi:hypothetical protein